MSVSKLVTESLSYTYEKGQPAAIDGVTLSMECGVPHFFCGPSGSGKTTLALLCAGLLTAQGGKLRWDNRPLTSEVRTGYVFQFPENLFYADSVLEEFNFLEPKPLPQQIDRCMAAVGLSLSALRERQPYRLSVGTGRALALALQLARDPQILIVDEPTIGLDDEHMERVVSALKSWLMPERLMIIITHDLNLVGQFDGRVHLLQEGRLGWSGAAAELLTNRNLAEKFGLL